MCWGWVWSLLWPLWEKNTLLLLPRRELESNANKGVCDACVCVCTHTCEVYVVCMCVCVHVHMYPQSGGNVWGDLSGGRLILSHVNEGFDRR